jgi:hypothetical protein
MVVVNVESVEKGMDIIAQKALAPQRHRCGYPTDLPYLMELFDDQYNFLMVPCVRLLTFMLILLIYCQLWRQA